MQGVDSTKDELPPLDMRADPSVTLSESKDSQSPSSIKTGGDSEKPGQRLLWEGLSKVLLHFLSQNFIDGALPYFP